MSKVFSKVQNNGCNVKVFKFTYLQVFHGKETRIAKLGVIGLQQAATFALAVRLHNLQGVRCLTVIVKDPSTTNMISLQTAIHGVLDINLASGGAFDCFLMRFTHAHFSQQISLLAFHALVRYLLFKKLQLLNTHTHAGNNVMFLKVMLTLLQLCDPKD